MDLEKVSWEKIRNMRKTQNGSVRRTGDLIMGGGSVLVSTNGVWWWYMCVFRRNVSSADCISDAVFDPVTSILVTR